MFLLFYYGIRLCSPLIARCWLSLDDAGHTKGPKFWSAIGYLPLSGL